MKLSPYLTGVFFLLAIFFAAPNLAAAAPSVSGVSGVVSDGQSVVIDGAGFGTKTVAASKYYNNFEAETTGSFPSDQMTNQTGNERGFVKTNVARSGAKSLEFDHCADYQIIAWNSGQRFLTNYVVSYGGQNYIVQSDIGPSAVTPNVDTAHFTLGTPSIHCTTGDTNASWRRNAIDFGPSGTDKVFMSLWLYMDKSTTTSRNWQWKNFWVTSNSNLYASLTSGESAAFYESWYNYSSGWNNTGSPYIYYWDFNLNHFVNSYGANAPADMFLWNQWQRVDMYMQRSSAGGVADGIINFNRVGRISPITNKTNAVTHADGDDPWRYLDLSNGIVSIYDGYADIKIYMDDVHVDTTQARVELCDTDTWTARTHCEIQPTTAWPTIGDPTANIAITMNQGTFSNGNTAYLYVIDATGAANTNGHPVVLGSVAGDTLAPSAPSGLGVM